MLKFLPVEVSVELKLDSTIEHPDHFQCSIELELMTTPVSIMVKPKNAAPFLSTYEKGNLMVWFDRYDTLVKTNPKLELIDPKSQVKLTDDDRVWVVNTNLAQALEDYKKGLKQDNTDLAKHPTYYCCPISNELMSEPVAIIWVENNEARLFTGDKKNVEAWIHEKGTIPQTDIVWDNKKHVFGTDLALRNALQDYKARIKECERNKSQTDVIEPEDLLSIQLKGKIINFPYKIEPYLIKKLTDYDRIFSSEINFSYSQSYRINNQTVLQEFLINKSILTIVVNQFNKNQYNHNLTLEQLITLNNVLAQHGLKLPASAVYCLGKQYSKDYLHQLITTESLFNLLDQFTQLHALLGLLEHNPNQEQKKWLECMIADIYSRYQQKLNDEGRYQELNQLLLHLISSLKLEIQDFSPIRLSGNPNGLFFRAAHNNNNNNNDNDNDNYDNNLAFKALQM